MKMPDHYSLPAKTVLILIVAIAAFLIAACSSPDITAATEQSTISTTSIAPTTVLSTAPSTSKPTETTEIPASFSDVLADYLAEPANGQSIADRGTELNGGQSHNACVFTVAEALRRVGCDIPSSTGYTPILVQQLKEHGFSVSFQLSELQPGDICFTTNEQGQLEGVPTHTFIFLAWENENDMRIFDNQSYDFGSPYHLRSITLTYFNDQTDRSKEATAFFMHK